MRNCNSITIEYHEDCVHCGVCPFAAPGDDNTCGVFGYGLGADAGGWLRCRDCIDSLDDEWAWTLRAKRNRITAREAAGLVGNPLSDNAMHVAGKLPDNPCDDCERMACIKEVTK